MNTHSPHTSVGLVGFGSMGAAMAKAMACSREFPKRFSLRILAKNKCAADGSEEGLVFTDTLKELVQQSDIIIIAVRPEQVEGLLYEIRNLMVGREPGPRKVLVSVAAGVPIDRLRRAAGNDPAVVRVMPNTLVEVGKGLFGLCAENANGVSISSEEKDLVRDLFAGLGTVVEIDESGMNAFTALAGCGPGFLFHIMDAFCEAGVSVGLGRGVSRSISVALMEGCGTLASVTGRHPVMLREQGTSPAGMTIAGLNHMDSTGLRGTLIDAVKIAAKQGERMDQDLGNE